MGFVDDAYLLESAAAEELYGEIADLPIVDPHTHADVREIVENDGWDDVWEVEAATDHYVWSHMRKLGVPEEKITGDAPNREKWQALAEVFPAFAGNPTYEWVHLDLKRRFGIDETLSSATAGSIWDETAAQLAEPSMRPQALLREMGVEVLCSTDDPTSELSYHERAESAVDGVDVYPTWRLDRAMRIDRGTWREFVDELASATGVGTGDLSGFLTALERTHDYFDDHGCRASDLGLREVVTEPVSRARAEAVYRRAIEGRQLRERDVEEFQAFLLEHVGELNRETGWVTQLHVGAVRDYRDELYRELGADAGGDVGTKDVELVDNLRYFLNAFDGELDVVLYTIDPTHYPTLTTLSRAFPRVTVGPAWWFNDSPRGMERQLDRMASTDLLGSHAGMVSDSRKLVSYGSRFEMFRRTLANVVGRMVERGRVPRSEASRLVEDLAYRRPKELYGFD